MVWSPQQENAIKSVKRWLGQRNGPQVFRLFGWAGSGKTTLAMDLAESARGSVLYAAFTGKAALIMRNKGCHGASTIHSLIYKPEQCPVTGEITFRLNHDSPVASAGLVVIDEVSMVGKDLAKDLLSYGTKILVLGDPAQLPPVQGEGFFINTEPDVMLTEIHRQAQDNPIIRLSMDVREGKRLTPGHYGDSRIIERRSVDRDAMRDLVLSADQVLCGLNKTRQTYNARVREIKGMAGEKGGHLPTKGDRLVCLRNNREKGLLNGGLWTVKRCSAKAARVNMTVESLDDTGGQPVRVEVPEEFFTGEEKKLDWKMLRHVDQMTYGYALTVHKSQGSQFANVLLFDESYVFREDASKHLYTGITRASEKVTVVI